MPQLILDKPINVNGTVLLTGEQVSSDILYQIKLHTGALSVRTDVRV